MNLNINEALKPSYDSSTSDIMYPSFFHLHNISTVSCSKEEAHTLSGQTYYVFMRLLSGSAIFKAEDQSILVHAENTILLLPFNNFQIIYTEDSTIEILLFSGILTNDYLTPETKQDGFYFIPHPLPFLVDQFKQIQLHFNMNRDHSSDFRLRSINTHNLLTDLLTLIVTSEKLPQSKSGRLLPPYLIQARAYMDEHYSLTLSLEDISELSGVSKYKFCHDFKEFYGISPLHYLNEQRISHAKKLLAVSDLTIHEIGSMVGIDNTNHFINLFKRYIGTTPLLYRQAQLHSPSY